MGRYDRATLVVIALWFALCVATMGYNGPLYDEAVHIIAGQRALQGYGISPGEAPWADGSLLWPFLAAAGYMVGGLTGARTVALGLTAIALMAAVRATRNLFGPGAGFWAAVSLAASGTFLALSRQAIPEAPALAGVAVSFMALTELARQDNRAWLGVATAAYAVAVLSAYPVALMALPLLGALFSLRPRRAVMDTAILGLAAFAFVAAFSLPLQQRIGQVAGWLPLPTPAPNVTPLVAWFSRLYLLSGSLPLAVVGWYVARGKRGLATVLLLSLATWPIYHTLTGNLKGESMHTVFGLVFISPLMGVALSTLWQHVVGKGAVVVMVLGLALLGAVQLIQLDHAWPDLRDPIGFLAGEVRPGERLLVNEAWPFTMYLYARGLIRSPWDVCDADRLTRGGSVADLCDYDWFVDVEGMHRWPDGVAEAVMDCRTFRPVYTATPTVISLEPELRYVIHPVRITIWRNMARGH